MKEHRPFWGKRRIITLHHTFMLLGLLPKEYFIITSTLHNAMYQQNFHCKLHNATLFTSEPPIMSTSKNKEMFFILSNLLVQTGSMQKLVFLLQWKTIQWLIFYLKNLIKSLFKKMRGFSLTRVQIHYASKRDKHVRISTAQLEQTRVYKEGRETM